MPNLLPVPIAIATSQPVLVSDVERLCAAAGANLIACVDDPSIRAAWSTAALVLVDVDVANRLESFELRRRAGVLIVGVEPMPDSAWRLAVSLGAEQVVELPSAEPWLLRRLAEVDEAAKPVGRVVAVTSASGGTGVSTLAAALAERSGHALLIDDDELGGGLDLLLGLEATAGLRWSELAEIRGHLSAQALTDALPERGRLHVLSHSRQVAIPPKPEIWRTVVDAGRRGCDAVVIDRPRSLDAERLAVVDAVAVLVPSTIRGIAAGRTLLASLRAGPAAVHAIVRCVPRTIPEREVVAALGFAEVAVLPHDGDLVARGERAEPSRARGPYNEAVRRVAASLGLAVTP